MCFCQNGVIILHIFDKIYMTTMTRWCIPVLILLLNMYIIDFITSRIPPILNKTKCQTKSMQPKLATAEFNIQTQLSRIILYSNTRVSCEHLNLLFDPHQSKDSLYTHISNFQVSSNEAYKLGFSKKVLYKLRFIIYVTMWQICTYLWLLMTPDR